jgi:hypothetical protein
MRVSKPRSFPQRSKPTPFSRIRIGEPDANAEYFAALRGKYSPVFIDCFFDIPDFPRAQFQSGEKYLIYGQKGTGKTAALRYLQSNGAKLAINSEFLIFKKAFIEEIDLQQFGKLPLMLDEESIKKFKHHYHTIKRLLILIILNKAWAHGRNSEADLNDLEDNESKNLIARISKSSIADVIRLGMDSVRSIFLSAGFDIEKATSHKLLIEGAKLLKRHNDDLLTFLIRCLKKTQKKVHLYLDEIHFAYRSEESLQQDAILVRDTILAVQALNERFAEENCDVVVYLAVRSEYLEQPIIATADINHTIESVGFELTWSTFPPSKDHPLFDLIWLRFRASIGPHFKKEDFFQMYLPNIDPAEFVERTWSKPRDFVRFFKCAQKLYAGQSSLSPSEANAVWRNYAQESWKEIKSAAAAFLLPEALTLFEHILAKLAPNILGALSLMLTNSLSI